MYNGEKPAFPTGQSQSGIGLTKREYFAAMAMQGLAANRNLIMDYGKYLDSGQGPQTFSEMLTKEALRVADELLRQLEK